MVPSNQQRKRGSEAIAPPEYKVVETSTVTEDVLERLINEWVGQGWSLEDIRFVVRDSSHRPVMAFILFTRSGKIPDCFA